MAQAARSGTGCAGELVAALRGWEFPGSSIELENISLRSNRRRLATPDPDQLPIRGRRGRREEEWGAELEDGSVEYAANLLMAIVCTHLMDQAAPPPEHARAAV